MQFLLFRVKIKKAIHRRLLGQLETGYESLKLCVSLWCLLTVVENTHRVINACVLVRVCVCMREWE